MLWQKKKSGKFKPGLSDSVAFNKCFPYSIQTVEKVLGSDTKDASSHLSFPTHWLYKLGQVS